MPEHLVEQTRVSQPLISHETFSCRLHHLRTLAKRIVGQPPTRIPPVGYLISTGTPVL